MSLSRNVTGREFQRHGPATEILLSPRRVRVRLVAYVKISADRSVSSTLGQDPSVWTAGELLASYLQTYLGTPFVRPNTELPKRPNPSNKMSSC